MWNGFSTKTETSTLHSTYFFACSILRQAKSNIPIKWTIFFEHFHFLKTVFIDNNQNSYFNVFLPIILTLILPGEVKKITSISLTPYCLKKSNLQNKIFFPRESLTVLDLEQFPFVNCLRSCITYVCVINGMQSRGLVKDKLREEWSQHCARLGSWLAVWDQSGWKRALVH